MALPSAYAWLAREPGPRMLSEALKLYGTLEKPGAADNPVILAWADEIAAITKRPYDRWAADFYADDSIPWCGVFAAICAARSAQGRPERFPPNKYLSALAWADWGVSVPKSEAMLGDILVFVRKGGGHVAIYVGEDDTAFHILGGNQSDKVSIVRKAKNQLVAVRRPPYMAQPANVRKVFLSAKGALSTNEQ